MEYSENVNLQLLAVNNLAYLMSGYLDISPDTSSVSMPGSFSLIKSASTGIRAVGFTLLTVPSTS